MLNGLSVKCVLLALHTGRAPPNGGGVEQIKTREITYENVLFLEKLSFALVSPLPHQEWYTQESAGWLDRIYFGRPYNSPSHSEAGLS